MYLAAIMPVGNQPSHDNVIGTLLGVLTLLAWGFVTRQLTVAIEC